MATIDIKRSHSLGKEGARQAAQSLADKLKEKLEIAYRWEGDVLKFDRSGASGKITVSESEVRVEVDLGMLMRPMKGMVEEKVNHYLDKALTPNAP